MQSSAPARPGRLPHDTGAYPAGAAGEAGGQRQVEADGDTVRELLDDLTERFPPLRTRLFEDGELAPFVNVYVGGEDVRTLEGLDTSVNGSADVILLPAMAGGSPSR